MTDGTLVRAAKPMWRRIVDFPLVAMVIAIVIYLVTARVATQFASILKTSGIGQNILEIIVSLVSVGLAIFIYKIVICKLGENPRDDLRREHAGRDLGFGLVGGTLLFSLVALIAGLLGVYDIVGLGSARSILFVAVIFGLFPGVIEELLFRGILFRHLEDFGGTWFALALTSALFGLAHFGNPNATLFSTFAIAVEAGILLGGAYMLTRSLGAPIGIHAAWNFTQSQFFDVPVSGIDGTGLVEAQLSGPELLSGGAFGLEASIIALVVATGAGLWMVIRAVRAGHIVRPWWVRRRVSRQNELARSEETVRVDVDRDPDLGSPVERT